MQRVAQAETVRGKDQHRVEALFARFPGAQLEARGVSARDADALFQQAKASKGRLPVRRVTQHACRHDEGVPFCVSDRVA